MVGKTQSIKQQDGVKTSSPATNLKEWATPNERGTALIDLQERSMALVWEERYSIGDGAVDAEHQEWFRLANDFLMSHEAQSLHESGEAFSQYTRHHFLHEETFMRELRYPLEATHVEDHEFLVRTLTKVLDVGKNVLTVDELNEFVSYCLVKHIDRHDAPLALYGRRNG
jgi:hemerythrin-like metal-binding protein